MASSNNHEPTVAQQPQPTPTPLPPAPALERPTYIVQRGTVERPLDVNGRVTPVDLVRLEFRIVLERKQNVLRL